MVPATIRGNLSRLRWRWRGQRLAWAGAVWLAINALVLTGACGVDWLVDRTRDTPWPLRVALTAAVGLIAGASAAVLLWWAVSQRSRDDALALWVEERLPQLQDRLISAIQLNRPEARTDGMSPALIAALTREAEQLAQRIDFAGLLDRRLLNRSLALVMPVAILGIAAWLICPDTATALLARLFLADREIPRRVTIECAEPFLVWPSGEPNVLRFRVAGLEPDDPATGHVLLSPEGQPEDRVALHRLDPTTYQAEVPAASADFVYRAWLKDGRTRRPGRVRYEPRPEIARLEAWLELPTYTGLRPDGRRYQVAQPQGDVAGPAGSAARVVIETQKPVVRAVVECLGPVSPDGPEEVKRTVPMTLGAEGRKWEATLDLRAGETAYRVRVEDEHGFVNRDPPRRTLRLLPDEPPTVTLLPERFDDDAEATPEDADLEGMPVPLGRSIRIAYVCQAPFGLGRAQLRYRINDGEWQTLPLAEVPATAQTGPFDFRRGAFVRSGPRDQVEFHAVGSTDPTERPGRLAGGGRFDFQTRALPGLKVGDTIEFYVEVFARGPEAERWPGRSESRVKTVVTEDQFLDWVVQTLQQERRIRQLEEQQQNVFRPRRPR